MYAYNTTAKRLIRELRGLNCRISTFTECSDEIQHVQLAYNISAMLLVSTSRGVLPPAPVSLGTPLPAVCY